MRMMLPTLLTIALLACPEPPPVPAPLTASERTEIVSEQLQVLRQQPAFTGRAVGYGAIKTKAYAAYETLLEVATDSELEGLLSDPAPLVRLYAFEGLLMRGHPRKVLMARLSKPAEKVTTRQGCFMSVETVAQVAQRLRGPA